MPDLNARIKHIPLPLPMRHRPIDERGFPIPYFVAYVDGKPDFRVMDHRSLKSCVKSKLCWLCGGKLGGRMTFVIGPMCAVNRISSEPPCHLSCAEYAVKACPFLTQPRMRRNEKDMPDERQEPAGVMIKRNPGVTLLWQTRSYSLYAQPNGVLFEIGAPEHITCWREGRAATWEEIFASIESGLPALRDLAIQEGDAACRALEDQLAEALLLLAPVGAPMQVHP
jgi:hypothetical protein